MRIFDTADSNVVPASTTMANNAARRVDFNENALLSDWRMELNDSVDLRAEEGGLGAAPLGCQGNRRSPARSRKNSGAHMTSNMIATCNAMASCSPCRAVMIPMTEPPMIEPR